MPVDVNEWTHGETTARVTVKTTRRPGRKAHWTAQVGEWFADGKTEREAATRLAESIATLAQARTAPTVIMFKGHVAVISATQNPYQPGDLSWATQTAHPDGHVGYSSQGGTLAEATASARHSLAQRVTDWHDDASVHEGAAFLDGLDAVDHGCYGPTGFYRYAAWQRAAKAAMDAGEADFHTWATEHAKEFEVPRPQ
jgi:hypothetical protein